ncbi:hypothetical protein K6119_09430 [Paracrocinitomix mangrovi]|uniref:hypothetical protein n=1 Tax=Paracrocinitomix mangrovi TaxID=2862509 RepID=UPI001C8E5B4A|nr:hypothetical protein [Paracrocinitomix mangrovi]UKN03711.1 hypothetical protein K6119_09430 [Paracrocinitomix mangrovi]
MAVEKEELQSIVAKIESNNLKSEAYFAIYDFGGTEECYIYANKQGLELYAAELLKASLQSDDAHENNEKNIVPIAHNAEWIDGEIMIQHVELLKEIREKIKVEKPKDSFWNKIHQLGCIIMLLIVIGIFVIGIERVINWIF